MGINKFTDLTVEEFRSLYTGFIPRKERTEGVDYYQSETFIGDVNWVTAGKV